MLDAVEAAFKELNSKVKAYMKRATGQEFDGADLMQRAFSSERTSCWPRRPLH